MTSPIAWPRFVEIVCSHQRFLLICHVRPDCDALGSELAMAGILEKLGKDVLPVNDFAIPPTLTFLDPQKQSQAAWQRRDARSSLPIAK